MATQQFVILSSEEPTGNGMAPLGSRDDLVKALGSYNTSPERVGEDVLFGPGIRVEMTPGQDPITQMLLTVTEEEIGWQVIQRLATVFAWKLLDPGSGREWKPNA